MLDKTLITASHPWKICALNLLFSQKNFKFIY